MKLIETTVYTTDPTKEQSVIVSADWNDRYGLLVIKKIKKKYELIINNDIIIPRLRLKYPTVRWISEHEILIVNNRVDAKEDNGFILSKDGAILRSFYLGDAIEDAMPTKDGVWISYFDEGVFGEGISTEGLVLFDFKGKPLFKYHTDLPDEFVIDDCYAICKGRASEMWVFAYSDFNLVHLSNKHKVEAALKVPEVLHGAKAMCIRNNAAYFYGSYKDGTSLYAWELGKSKSVKIGDIIAEEVRGLGNRETNHFIGISVSGVTLIKIEKEENSLL